MWSFSDFQFGFRSSRSTADLLTVVSDRIARTFNRSGATRAVVLDISKAFDLRNFRSDIWPISSFLSNRQLRVVLDGKSSQEFLKAPFVVLHFSCYTLMTFLMMLSVILLSMLMILFSILSVIRHLICGNNSNWLLNLNLIYGWGKKWLVDFSAGKTRLVSFDRSNNTGSIDVKMDGSFLEEKSSFKMLGLTFSSKLDWGSYIISIAKTASKKIGALIRSMKFLSPEVALYLYKSTICPCMEYCCQVWAGAPSYYLELLDKVQKRIYRTVGPSLAAPLEPLAHH